MSSFSSLISGSVMKIWHANALVDQSWPRDVIFSGSSEFEIFNLRDIVEIFYQRDRDFWRLYMLDLFDRSIYLR